MTTQQIENYLSEQSGIDLTEFFNQYLRDVRVPTLEYEITSNVLKYRWTEIIEKFDMPIQVIFDGEDQWLFPKAEWQSMPIKNSTIEIDSDFYIMQKQI